jgi:DNA-binding IclR family transcriptional regulator
VLAHLPAAHVRALFPDASAFVERHGTGPVSLSALRRILVDVRQRGHATEDGEVTPGFASLAAPVFDHTGRPVAGVAVTFPSDDVPPDARAALLPPVVRAAAELSRRLGARPHAG